MSRPTGAPSLTLNPYQSAELAVLWQKQHQSHRGRHACPEIRIKWTLAPQLWGQPKECLTTFIQHTVFYDASQSSRGKFSLNSTQPQYLGSVFRCGLRETNTSTMLAPFLQGTNSKLCLTGWRTREEILKWYFTQRQPYYSQHAFPQNDLINSIY